jgi:hypothetical protein
MILVKEEATKEYLKKNKYARLYENLNGYAPFQKGHCNCDSMVGSLKDRQEISYAEAIANSKKEKVEKLTRIRELMQQPDYLEKKEKFMNERDEYSRKVHASFEALFDYEEKRKEELKKIYNGENLEKKLDKLHLQVNERLEILSNSPEIEESRALYLKFIEDNQLMQEASRYYLTKEEEEKENEGETSKTELPDILEQLRAEGIAEENIRIITKESTSLVIDEIILRAEGETDEETQKEFAYYLKVFKELLEYEQEVCFATIWSETNELKEVKTIGLDSLRIDNFVFLDFNEMIRITR